MKSSSFKFALRFLILSLLVIIPIAKNFAQLQRYYGSGINNTFSKVIKDGANYYVLGQDGLVGSVTRLDANGQHQWTLVPSISCIWNDGVLAPNGDLLVVGSTLPLDANTKSLIGRVTPAGGGNFAWLRSYDTAGRDFYYRIVKNSVPNPAFPYYILGSQNQPGSTPSTDDVVLLNMDVNGTFNWKVIFDSGGDDEFSRDLEIVSGGLLMAGNSSSGLIYMSDYAGNILAGVQLVNQMVFRDVSASSSGEIYAAGTTNAGAAHIMKFDQNLLLIWDVIIPQLTSATQVWEGQPGDIYVTGRETIGGISRGVVVMMTDNGTSVSVNWLKYLNTGTSFTDGSSWLMPTGEIAFTDGRIISGGFGLNDAFFSLSDLNFTTCGVAENVVDLTVFNPTPDSPSPPASLFQEIPIGSDLLIYQELDWQQQEVCSNDPCMADFFISSLDNCGHVQVTNTSTGVLPLTYQWCDGSTSADLDVHLPCGSNTFCLTITDATGCTSSSTQSINVIDHIPPIARCALPVGVILDANCTYTITPAQIDGGSTDNCQIQSLSVSPTVLMGCGVFPVTLTVTDWCGNTSTCITHIQTIEDIPPVITCPPNVTVTSTGSSPCSKIVNGLSWLTATDNCGTTFVDYVVTGATSNFGQNDASGLTYNQGVSTITYTATDDCGNTDTCSFNVTVKCTPDSCCIDSLAFIIAAQNVQTLGALGDCVLYFWGDGLTDCMQITYYWGDPSGSSTGPISGNNVGVSHTYTGSGTYYVCYRIDELNGSDICWSYTHCDSVLVLCESAGCCPEFSLKQLGSIIPCPGDNNCLGDTTGGAKTIVACKNSVQTYYVIPNLPGFTYNWSVVGGILTSLQGYNPGVISWGNGSQGFIQVIIADTTGNCRDTITQKVCLADAPIAAFTITPSTTVCTNQPVVFTNTSVGANTYSWNFGDGTGFTSANPPPHSYSTAGMYTVLLTVSNYLNGNSDFLCGCQDTASVIITVLAGTGPTITTPGCKEMFCPGDTATYCVSLGCASYNWTINGGTIIATHDSCITVHWNTTTPLTLPAFVSVTTGCGGSCGSSATLNVPVLWNAMPISGPTPVCVGTTETYSLPTMPGTFYMWTVTGGGGFIVGPNQNTPTITVKWNGPAGPATIICNYNNPFSDCSGSDTLMVDVKNKFTIGGPTPVCVGTPSSYTSNGNADWTITPPTGYSFGGATSNVSSISVNWSLSGNYTITATPPPLAYCNPNAVMNVVVNPAPVINIVGPLKVCPNQLYNYTASSTLSGGTFTWSIVGPGGGTISPYGPGNSNASVNFTGTGPWTLMVMQTVNGCPGSATLLISKEPVPALPSATITACIGSHTTMIQVLPGSIGPYTWSTSPAASLISVQGTVPAIYEIHGNGTITVSNCSGVSNAINVVATTPQVISITATGSLCLGNLQLHAPSCGAGTSYNWFGPLSANTQTISVTQPGTYTVQDTCPGGCISVDTFTVRPVAIPTVSISTGDPLGWCIPAIPSVNLQAFTLSNGCTYQWFDVANSSIQGATHPTYTATSAGSYYVEVVCGSCVTTSNIITVAQITCSPTTGNCAGMPNPLSAITASACNPKSFSIGVTGCTGGVVSWNFGDGSIATGISATHNYANPGAYLVTASITCNGCTFVVFTNVNVPVVADFNSSVSCGTNGSYTITLNNTSQTLGGWNVSSVNWTTSCGTPLTGSGNQFIVNTSPGCNPTVTMIITVTDSTGVSMCADTIAFPFILPTAPLSILGTTMVCKNETYQFNSSMTGPSIVQYEWTVNGTPVSQNDSLSYAFNGNPTHPVVGLTVTDIFGCTFTASVTINVVAPRPLTIAPVKICPDCLPPASLSAIPIVGFINYQWYHNGVLIIGANSSTYQLCQFDASGNYFVTAEDIQNNNCRVTSNTVQVVYNPKPVADILGQTVQCVSGNGPYTILPLANAGGNNPNYSYNWTATGPGTITFTPGNLPDTANVLVTAIGTYQFILTVTDTTTGCMAKDTFCVYLSPNPIVTISGPVGVLCEGASYTFTASATPAANYVYQWSNGVTGPTMTTSQPGYYSVSATNPESGCLGAAYAAYIRPRPSTILFPVGCDTICDSDSIMPPFALGVNGLPPGYTAQWYLNGTYFFTGPVLNLASHFGPLVHGLNNISIIVTYQGCSDTSNVYNLFIEKCCVCKSELVLYHGGVEYPVFCDPHEGFIPSLPCPADNVTLSGFFGFADPITGEPCEETPVIWQLVEPDMSTHGGIATNFSAYLFFKDSVETPGLYCLTLTTISPDGQDTCVCIVKWYREPCDCCTTLEDFCERLENNVTFTVNQALCKATVKIGSLPDCDHVTGINWGDGSFNSGPFNTGDMPMHSYSGSGTYIISYAALEFDANGFICFEKTISDTITLNCAGCHCGTFSDMFISWGQGAQSHAMSCGDGPIFIGCPLPGMSYTFTGLFQCSGNACADELLPITWTLSGGPSGTYTGVTTASPNFGITLLPTYFFNSGGAYTLTLSGPCGNQICSCVIKFNNDCPQLCPCTPQAVQALTSAVNQGFAQALSSLSCKACFTPIAVSDCETVEWYLTNTGGSPIGTSIGHNTFCYNFPGSGTYTVIMVVTRKKADGSNCVTITKSQTVKVNCLNIPLCINSVIDNPTFSEGSIAGGLNSGGHTNSWKANSGNPKLNEGQIESLDGWTILLSGNLDTADVLTSIESICLDKGAGTLRTRVRSTKSNVSDRIFPTTLKFYLGSTETFVFKQNDCEGIDCYEIGSIVLPAVDSGEWLELEIPYNLSNWDAFDACGGLLVRPYIFVTNALSNTQGGVDTYSYAELDNFCLDGTLVAVEEPVQKQGIRIYPNPSKGELILQVNGSIPKDGIVQIIDLYGRLMLTEKLLPEKESHTLSIASFPSGVYFVKVFDKGMPVSIQKVIKE
ncbi:MAG: PKD domain-containing protein [Saprospiraceae bacterium]